MARTKQTARVSFSYARPAAPNDFPCCVENAKSGRAQCRTCSRAIAKGVVRIGQQYDRDHSGYHWYHIACFRNFPQDGSTTAENFLFGFESLSASDKAKVQNVLEGRAAVPGKAGSSDVEEDDDDDEEEEEEEEEENEEEESAQEEEQDIDLDNLARYSLDTLQKYCTEEHIPVLGKTKNALINAILKYNNHYEEGYDENSGVGVQPTLTPFQQPAAFSFPNSSASAGGFGSSASYSSTFGGCSPLFGGPEAVPGLRSAVNTVGGLHDASGFFSNPPQGALRALRAAIEAFEIGNDADELADTLTLVRQKFGQRA